MPCLILASSSPYRRELLSRLQLKFSCVRPDIDETPHSGETAPQLAERLARQKARTVAANHPGALVIGSDQVACLNGKILGKPGNQENARRQLLAASGQEVIFYTGLCLWNVDQGSGESCVETFTVQFRRLSERQIDRYLEREQPFDCAGSFKAEGLGIALFEKLSGDDPNTLVGLPLIQLVHLLEGAGVAVL